MKVQMVHKDLLEKCTYGGTERVNGAGSRERYRDDDCDVPNGDILDTFQKIRHYE